jgi:dipeptidase
MSWFKVSATQYVNESGVQLNATATTVTLTPAYASAPAVVLNGTYGSQAAANAAMLSIMEATHERVLDPANLVE